MFVTLLVVETVRRHQTKCHCLSLSSAVIVGVIFNWTPAELISDFVSIRMGKNGSVAGYDYGSLTKRMQECEEKLGGRQDDVRRR